MGWIVHLLISTTLSAIAVKWSADTARLKLLTETISQSEMSLAEIKATEATSKAKERPVEDILGGNGAQDNRQASKQILASC